MGYLQMQLMNETTETITIGICLNIDKFYADLDFTANSDFENGTNTLLSVSMKK